MHIAHHFSSFVLAAGLQKLLNLASQMGEHQESLENIGNMGIMANREKMENIKEKSKLTFADV